MKRNPFEIAFDNVLAGAAYASQSSDSASVKEQHMDKVEKIMIGALVVFVAALLLLAGFSLYASWYTATHHDYGMTTVKTGDVTWACLKDRGTYIGCNTVEEYK